MALALGLLLSLFASEARAAVTDAKFSVYQTFDVQYSWSGSTLNVFNMTRPFRTTSSPNQMTQAEIDGMVANDRYFALFTSGCAGNASGYGFAVYNANGTVHQVLHNTGTLTALDSDVIFYLGGGVNGTILTPSYGYSYGDAASFQVENRNPTCADAQNYVPPSTEPLDEGEAPPPPLPQIGGWPVCTAAGGTDVIFLLDNSGSIEDWEYSAFSTSVMNVGQALRAANPATRIAVAHYAGDHTPQASFGQNIYFERDFSTAAVTSSTRRFGLTPPLLSASGDNMAGAVYQMSFGLDANASTTSSHILSPLKELSRDLSRPLQIVAFTDALRDVAIGSSIIDGPGYGYEPDDGSSFTIYNLLKAQGVKFSVMTLPSGVGGDAARDAAAAAIASIGGSWMGAKDVNSQDPEGSGTPRRMAASPAFTLDSAQILDFVTPIANICPPPSPMDYGDAPASYGTPSHVVSAGGPYLGWAAPDAESAPHHSADALGDDQTGIDDEDGVMFTKVFVVGQATNGLAFTRTGAASGYLNAWIDWNRDGDFQDAGEHILVNRTDGPGDDFPDNGRIDFSIQTPAWVEDGTTYYARFRISSQPNLDPHLGIAPDGEIEDHAIFVESKPPPTGPVPAIGGVLACTADGGTDVLFLIDNSFSIDAGEYASFASSVVNAGNSLRAANPATRIGVAHYAGLSDTHDFGQHILFERDFSTAAVSSPARQFSAGGAFNASLHMDNLAGAVLQMSYGLDRNAATTSSYILGALKEMNRDLSRPLQIVLFTDASRDGFGNSSIIDGEGYAYEPNDGSNFAIYNQLKAQGVKFSVVALPSGAGVARDVAAAAIASVGGSWAGSVEANFTDPEGSGATPRRLTTSTSFALSPAEIADFITPVANQCPPPRDFSDAPASYGTPSHMIVSGGPHLGANAPDAETASLHSLDALGDDLNGADDEDGISVFPLLTAGATSYSIPAANVSAAGTGTLHVWIDFDKNGVFTANEGASATVTSGVLSGPLNWSGITVGSAGGSFARLRFTTSALTDDPATPALDERATASASDGEVEDHAVTFVDPPPPSGPVGACAGPNRLLNGDFANSSNWSVGYPSLPTTGSHILPELGLNSSLTNAPLFASNADGVFTSRVDNTGDLAGVSTLFLRNDTTLSVVNGQSYVVSYDLHTFSLTATGDATLSWVLIDPATNAIVQTIPGVTRTLNGQVKNSWFSYGASFSATVPTGNYKLAMTFAPFVSGVGFVVDFRIDRVYFGPAVLCDYGDAPASFGAPRHALDGALKLGANAPDAEAAPQHSADALGDDQNGLDDEDGILAFPPLQVSLSSSYGIPAANLSATGTGTLHAWIDFDLNGVFTANEHASVAVTDGVLAGPLSWAGITRGIPGQSFLRLRFTSATLADLSATPNLDERSTVHAHDGEVEDHSILITRPPRDALIPFACDNQLYVGYGVTGILSRLDLRNGALPQLTYEYGTSINAAGYRRSDNLAYMLNGGGATRKYLLAVGANGQLLNQGQIVGLPVNSYAAGDFDGNGRLVVRSSHAGGVDLTMHVVDVDLVAVVDGFTPTGLPVGVFDFAYDPTDGWFYTVAGTQVWRFRQGVAAAQLVGDTGLASAQYDAIFSNAGRLFAADAVQGRVYEIDKTTGAANFIGAMPVVTNPDGFSCPTAAFLPEVDFTIAKTNNLDSLLPGQIIEYLVTVANDGPATVSGAILADPVAAGLNKTAVSCWASAPGQCVAPPTIAQLESGSFALPSMAAGQSYSFIVTAQVVAADGSVRNIASISAPSAYQDYNLTNNLSTDIDEVTSAPLLLTPNHEATVEAGQLAIYPHRLQLSGELDGGALSFTLESERGLEWTLLRDEGDGVYGAGDLPWVQGSPVSAGEHFFWLVAKTPQNAPGGWSDLTRMTAFLVKNGATWSDEVQDLTRVGGVGAGSLFARKLQASDADCDGAPDGGEAGFTERTLPIAPGGCAVYRILFENRSVDPIRQVRVHDHTPNWMTYVGDSAIVIRHPASLTPQLVVAPANGAEGSLSFPFDGTLRPGEGGEVQFGVQLPGRRIDSGGPFPPGGGDDDDDDDIPGGW